MSYGTPSPVYPTREFLRADLHAAAHADESHPRRSRRAMPPGAALSLIDFEADVGVAQVDCGDPMGAR